MSRPSSIRLSAPHGLSSYGFSLLEVMVAIAILGLTLTVILSAQGGLAASNRSASNMGQAVALGRCKMTETEERLLKFGYQLTDDIRPDEACCDDTTTEVFVCDIKVERIELPNFQSGNSLGDGGTLISPSGSANLPGMINPAGSAGLDLNVEGGLAGMGSSLLTQFGGAGAGVDGLLGMVMGILYPSIKPMYEAAIRKISVTVRWKEGPNQRELPLVQYVTNPQMAGFAANALLPDGGMMDFSGEGGAPTTGTGTTGTGTGTTGTGLGTGTGTR